MMEAAYSLMQLAKHLKLASLLRPKYTFHYVPTRRQELLLTRC
jgi:hypothetical protein